MNSLQIFSMRCLTLSMLTACVLFTQTPLAQVTNMFLATPSHLPGKPSVTDDCFNTLAWKLDAGAAVRTTPVCDHKNAYFGTEKGDFYSADIATGKIIWKFTASHPIHTSAALRNGNVFFSDTKQTLYALSAATGRVKWQKSLGVNKPYDWKFDFLWSSPTISGDTLYIGSGDGNLYCLQVADGKLVWKYAATGHIRCSPAVAKGKVFFGDMSGSFFAVSSATGKIAWRFDTHGARFVNDSFGYDRKGIVSSPVITGNKVLFGSRDGYLYNINIDNGTENWAFNYNITWVISSVATDGKTAYAGTSDGRFVNVIDLYTGKEIWRTQTNIVWSSPLLVNDKMYVGGYDGQLYCLNRSNGLKIHTALYTGSRIQSSPVVAGNKLLIGSDDGYLYAMQSAGVCKEEPGNFIKYVYYDREVPRFYFRNGTDILLRANLVNIGFNQIDSKGLEDVIKRDIPADSNVVVVLASGYLPDAITSGGKTSLLRKYLDKGGRIVVTGLNPAVFALDKKTNEIKNDFALVKDVFDIDYPYSDSRAHGGFLYCKATKEGTKAGLPSWWMAPYSIDKKQVDLVLGENSNDEASAYVKKYSSRKNSGLIQVWIDAEFIPADINFVGRIALADL